MSYHGAEVWLDWLSNVSLLEVSFAPPKKEWKERRQNHLLAVCDILFPILNWPWSVHSIRTALLRLTGGQMGLFILV
jgi:hypothetical protein